MMADSEPGAAIEGMLMNDLFQSVDGGSKCSSGGIGQLKSRSNQSPGRAEADKILVLNGLSRQNRPSPTRPYPVFRSPRISLPLSILHPPFIRSASSKAVEERERRKKVPKRTHMVRSGTGGLSIFPWRQIR
jgi:hypothetical protein